MAAPVTWWESCTYCELAIILDLWSRKRHIFNCFTSEPVILLHRFGYHYYLKGARYSLIIHEVLVAMGSGGYNCKLGITCEVQGLTFDTEKCLLQTPENCSGRRIMSYT